MIQTLTLLPRSRFPPQVLSLDVQCIIRERYIGEAERTVLQAFQPAVSRIHWAHHPVHAIRQVDRLESYCAAGAPKFEPRPVKKSLRFSFSVSNVSLTMPVMPMSSNMRRPAT